jgi:hypothetical protein
MKIVLQIFIFIVFAFFTACNIINPAEKIPTYIMIDSLSVLPTVSATHGSVSHKITDVWAYYNFQLLGAFELPAKIPVFAEGKGQLQLVAGIWDNGLSGTRAKYPFFQVDTFTFNANPTSNIHYVPKFKYRTADTPKISYYIEDFEQGNGFVALNGDTTLVKTSAANEVFEGNWSAKLELNTANPTGESITSEEYMPPPNKDCYIELNYKSDVNFDIRTQVYHIGTTVLTDVMSLKAKENWTKVYIRFTGFTSSFQYGKFKFIIKSALPEGTTSANLLIDNFKIIYYN